MKTAGMVLGVIGGLLGIFGGMCSGAIGAAAGDQNGAASIMGVAIGISIFAIIISIVLKVAKGKKVGGTSGVLLIIAGIASVLIANFTSSPFMILGGILGTVGALKNSSSE